MTLAIAWVACRSDGREDLYFAADSRTRGGITLDSTPKIITLPRSDCAICFAGDTMATFPLMLHISAAIAAHAPAHDRNMDIKKLKGHLLKVCTDIVRTISNPPQQLTTSDMQFIFGGYSWRSKEFCIWTFCFDPKRSKFTARNSSSFCSRLEKAAFVGDWAVRFRSALAQMLSTELSDVRVVHEPLKLLTKFLKDAPRHASIGGAPQVVRVGPHMNTRPFCVKWGSAQKRHLFGRVLFEYENCDYWTIDPETGYIEAPRHFDLDKEQGTVEIPPAAD